MDVLHNSINNLAHEYRLVFYHHTALIFHALIFLFLPFSKQFFPLFSLSLFLLLVSLFALSNCCSKNKFSICYHTNSDLDTLTDFGSVARGVCEVSDDNRLISVTERTRIEKTESGAAYTENNGCSWTTLPKNSIVSMNLWGFTPSILTELETGFPSFLTQVLQSDPIKGEYFLPSVVSGLIAQDKADVTVLYSPDKWYGVTYKEDKQCVVEAVAAMKAAGFYPNKLWESL